MNYSIFLQYMWYYETEQIVPALTPACSTAAINCFYSACKYILILPACSYNILNSNFTLQPHAKLQASLLNQEFYFCLLQFPH